MTLREIRLARHAKEDHEWMQTSCIMAIVANIRQRGKGDRRNYKPTDFYRPHCQRKEVRKGGMTVGQLRSMKPVFERWKAEQ